MADFNDLLNELRNPSEDGPPETIYDDIAGAYNHAIETRDAKITESEQRIKDSESEISKLKSANYDLMMASSVEEDSGSEDSETDEAPAEGIEELFD